MPCGSNVYPTGDSKWLFKLPEISQNDIMRQIIRRTFVFSVFVAVFGFQVAVIYSQEIKIDTDLAIFEITVVDKNGAPVPGLSASDFRLYENETEREIAFFQPVKGSRRPLSIVLALDVSGSMTEDEIRRLKEAVNSFLDQLSDYNTYISVVSFAMEVKLEQSFTNRREKLEKSLDRLARNRNGLSTHAYDAIDYSIRLIEKKSPRAIAGAVPRRAVIVITDGFPVGDTTTPGVVIERANAANVTIYNIILPSFARMRSGTTRVPTPLEISGVTNATGGKSYVAGDKSPAGLLANIAEEITGSYAIAYYPENVTAPEAPRIVRIESISGYKVRQNRKTYVPGK